MTVELNSKERKYASLRSTASQEMTNPIAVLTEIVKQPEDATVISTECHRDYLSIHYANQGDARYHFRILEFDSVYFKMKESNKRTSRRRW